MTTSTISKIFLVSLIVSILGVPSKYAHAYSNIPPQLLMIDQKMIHDEMKIVNLKINTRLVNIGMEPDRRISTPTNPDNVGVYYFGARPGEIGTTIIVGHLDSEDSTPAVFWNLHSLKPEGLIVFSGTGVADAVYKVDLVSEFAQDKFPSKLVYSQSTKSKLRLITCSGRFNHQTNNYSHNIVVFASLLQ